MIQSTIQNNLKPLAAVVAIAVLIAIAAIIAAICILTLNATSYDPSTRVGVMLPIQTALSGGAAWLAIWLFDWAVKSWRD